MANAVEKIQNELQDDRTRLTIKNLLLDWQNAKGDLAALKSALDKEFGQKDAEIFMSINVKKLQTLIQQINLQKRGNVKKLQWHTVDDDQVCETCRNREGKEFSVDEIHELMPAHEGCRCEFKPVYNLSISEKKLREIMENK